MKNNKYSTAFSAIGLGLNGLAFLISLLGVWLLPFAFIPFGLGTIFILLTNLKPKVKALIIFGTLVAMALPTIYYVSQV